MWFLRCLAGPAAGKVYPLKPGRNVVGRAAHCDVSIPSQSISKEHAVIEVYNDKIIVSDMSSRNGTFINGVQIKSQKLQAGEKISLHDILIEIVQKSSQPNKNRPTNLVPRQRGGGGRAPAYQGNVAYQQDAMMDPQMAPQGQPQPQAQAATGIWQYFLKYIDEIVLPGVYKLAEWMEFRMAVGLFVASFVVLVTTLSTIPLTRILKASVEKEAQNRAQTIAKLLVRDNQAALAQGQSSLVTVENAMNEPGVSQAYILSNTGDILAPASMAGQYLTSIPFVNEARKFTSVQTTQLDDSTVVAVAPILSNNPNTQQISVVASSIVVYNMGALAVDSQRTISLFIQVLAIALFAGFILYFLLYKLVEQPVRHLNLQLDSALRDNKREVATPYLFPELQLLATNINSAMSRSGGSFGSDNLKNFEADRSVEMQNVVNIVGFPTIAVVPSDRRIAAVNTQFESQVGAGQQWVGLTLDKILDQALKLNINGLVDRVAADPAQLVQDQLEIGSQNYDLSAQGVMGSQAVAYILISFVPKGGG